jgi:hypothetical protein
MAVILGRFCCYLFSEKRYAPLSLLRRLVCCPGGLVRKRWTVEAFQVSGARRASHLHRRALALEPQ